MPVVAAMVLILGVVVFAIALIGLVWAIVFLLPFYAYVGIAVYLVWRSNRRKAELEATIVREVERQPPVQRTRNARLALLFGR